MSLQESPNSPTIASAKLEFGGVFPSLNVLLQLMAEKNNYGSVICTIYRKMLWPLLGCFQRHLQPAVADTPHRPFGISLSLSA